MRKLAAVLLIFAFIPFYSCRDSKEDEQEETGEEFIYEPYEEIEYVKRIFYALPSPVETAFLLKSSGAVYDEELLSKTENSGNYLTTKSKALNLGIYITDLSYVSFFDQTQESIRYMATVRELAESMGVMDAFDNRTVERLEANLNNRDVVMDIISESYMRSSAFLSENRRDAIAAMVFTGGWVEGLYLALNLADTGKNGGNGLVEHIAGQKLSLDLLMRILEENSHNSDVAELLEEMEKIYEVYGQMDAASTDLRLETGEDDKAVIVSDREVSMTQSQLRELKRRINGVRSSFVSY